MSQGMIMKNNLNFRYATLIVLLFPIFMFSAGPSKGNVPRRPVNLNKMSGLGVDANEHGNRRLAIHNGNKILTRFTNYGSIADWRNSPGRYDCGIYPIGSGRSYLAEFSPIVAAEVTNAGGGMPLHVVSDGMPSSSPDGPTSGDYLWQFEPRLGYANANDSLIAMSDDSLSWPESWPDKPADWDGTWAGQYGKYNRADQESYFRMDDYNNDEFDHYPIKLDSLIRYAEITLDPDSDDFAILTDMNTSFSDLIRDNDAAQLLDVHNPRSPDVVEVIGDKWYQIDSLLNENQLRLKVFAGTAHESPPGTEYWVYDGIKRGVGVDVATRGYQWAHPAAEDILIFTYWIKNISSWDYQKFIFGMYGDADVGDDGDQRDDDAWFDTGNDIVYQWDHDLWSTNDGGFVPAYFGWKYLESPGNPLDSQDNDEDGMVDESQDDGIDNDGDWDPYVDDTGSDGIGINFGEYTGPDADGTEGNGIPDIGEPNFEYTDNDESDQIGLTSFTAAAWPGIDLTMDGVTWGQLAPGSFTNIQQTVDLTFMYGSAYFALPRLEERKFAVAVIFGNDYEDILRNSETMQQIYNSDYNFAKPPNLPQLTAVPGDGRVTLYWDDKSELSVDPIYGMDFEGYRIYRATDPAFNEIWEITDTYGNQTFNKPIAQFDKADGLTGPHPYGLNGIHLDMGSDTGLRHSWTDSTVQNGQTYYYAVVSYDYGFDYDFYERGISDVDLRPPITPSECTKKIEINASGDPVDFDINTAMVVPNAPAMAYVAAEIVADDVVTLGTGTLEVSVIDPSRVQNDDRYQITFHDWSEDGLDNDGDWQTWTDDSTRVHLLPTLDMVIPPNSDTLVINLSQTTVSQGVTETTTSFIYANYQFYTSFVDTQTVDSGDSTYLQYFIEIPDSSFTLYPTLGVWDGWEPLYSDLGTDGCNDEYETGDPNNPCSETALNLGNDPNGDNWDPISNPSGTQANASPDLGEPNIDSNDIDELGRATTSYALMNITSGRNLLINRTDLSGENRELVREGLRVNLENDETAYNEAESGWLNSGLNFEITVTAEKFNTVQQQAVPFDYLLTINSNVTDTSIDNKRLAFDVRDLTNDVPVKLLAPTVSDTILRPEAVFYPTISTEDELRVTWKLTTAAKAGDIGDIIQWDELFLFATENDGIGVYDGQTWSNITTDAGLLSNYIQDFSFDRSGNLLVGSTKGLNVYQELGWRSFSIDMVTDGNAENDKQDYVSFDKVIEDSEGILWSLSTKGILRWDWHRSQFAEILSENEITTIDWSADTFSTVSGDTIITGVIQNESIDILALGGGKIVVGTKSEGLEFYEPADSSFWYLNEDNSDLPSDKILSLALNGNDLYIGTQKGLAIYNLLDSVVTYSNKDSLLDKKVRDVMVDSDGLVHIVTSKGYNTINISATDTVYTALDKDDIVEFGTNKLQCIEQLSDGNIWIGTENSVLRNSDGTWENWAPEPGDQFIIKVNKPFSALDTLFFTASGAEISDHVSESLLENIAVVPNPYVVTASWEPQHLYDSGRGIRKIDFIHLPPECTIRIYSLSGKYINTIEHSSEIWDGAESWNLLSRDGLEIAYGVYIYHIEAPGIGNHISKFAVIK